MAQCQAFFVTQVSGSFSTLVSLRPPSGSVLELTATQPVHMSTMPNRILGQKSVNFSVSPGAFSFLNLRHWVWIGRSIPRRFGTIQLATN